jgi:hypothetical protein
MANEPYTIRTPELLTVPPNLRPGSGRREIATRHRQGGGSGRACIPLGLIVLSCLGVSTRGGRAEEQDVVAALDVAAGGESRG